MMDIRRPSKKALGATMEDNSQEKIGDAIQAVSVLIESLSAKATARKKMSTELNNSIARLVNSLSRLIERTAHKERNPMEDGDPGYIESLYE
jgi:hypothetical protein